MIFYKAKRKGMFLAQIPIIYSLLIERDFFVNTDKLLPGKTNFSLTNQIAVIWV